MSRAEKYGEIHWENKTLEKVLNTFFISDFTVFLMSRKVVVRKSRSGLASYFTRDNVIEYELDSRQDFQKILARISRELNPQPSDRWFLGLPVKDFTLVNFSLPSAAADNLDEAVRYALMRHITFDLDQSYINYRKTELDGHLDISATVIHAETVSPLREAAEAEGIILHNIFPSLVYWSSLRGDGIYASLEPEYGEILVRSGNRTVMQNWGRSRKGSLDNFLEESGRLLANVPKLPGTLFLSAEGLAYEHVQEKLGISPESTESLDWNGRQNTAAPGRKEGGYEISLLPRSFIKQQMIAGYLMYGGIIFFLVCLMVLPISKLAGQSRHLTKIERQIEGMSQEAEELTTLRQESARMINRLEAMSEMKNEYPSAVNILAELTEAVPETAWVQSLRMSGHEVTIEGEADSATSVLESVENSPGFHEVEFRSPVSRSGNMERFTLVAKVK